MIRLLLFDAVLGGILQEVSNTPSADDNGGHAEAVSDVCTAVSTRVFEATPPPKSMREMRIDSHSLNHPRAGSLTPVKQMSGNSSSMATGSTETQLGMLVVVLFFLRRMISGCNAGIAVSRRA
jgi:hypothetical protein